MMTDPTPDDDDALLAAEYALGLLTGDELVDARNRAAQDSVFAQLVTDWEIRLATLADDLEPQAPTPSSKRALMAKVFPQPAAVSFWIKIWVWQGISAISVLALVAVLAMDFGPQIGTDGALQSAEIVSDIGDFRVVAVVDRSVGEVILTRTAGAPPEGRILQVWAHGPDEPAMSVGLWLEGDTARLRLPQAIAAIDTVLTLGVSEEPPGGSPTGSPSGRVFGTVDIAIASGAL